MIQYMHYVIYITVLTLIDLGIYNTIGYTGIATMHLYKVMGTGACNNTINDQI